MNVGRFKIILFFSVFFAVFVVGRVFVPYQSVIASEVKKSSVDDLNKKIQAQKDRVAQIEKSIEETKKRISERQNAANSLKNQIAILEGQSEEVGLEIDLAKSRLETALLEISELEGDILEKSAVIVGQEKIIGEFVREMYYDSQKSLLEVMVSYDRFSDFYNRLSYLETIKKDLGKSVRNLKTHRESLELSKMDAESRKQAYEKLKIDLQEKHQDLVEQNFLKENLLAETRAEERTYTALLGNLRKQYQQIESEIVSYEREVRRKLEEEERLRESQIRETPAGNSGFVFSWPTDSRYVTAYFRDPSYPYRHVFEHNAIDIRAAQGTPVKAAAAGYIGRAKKCSSSSCYSYVMVIHSGGFSTVYGHLSQISVDEEKFVARGDVIGYSGGRPGTVGAGPFVTGPHLHFEVRQNGLPVNPLSYLVKDY